MKNQISVGDVVIDREHEHWGQGIVISIWPEEGAPSCTFESGKGMERQNKLYYLWPEQLEFTGENIFAGLRPTGPSLGA